MSKEQLKLELDSLKQFEESGGLKMLGPKAQAKFVERKIEVMTMLLEE